MTGRVDETRMLILSEAIGDDHYSPLPEDSSDFVNHSDMEATGERGRTAADHEHTIFTGPADAGVRLVTTFWSLSSRLHGGEPSGRAVAQQGAGPPTVAGVCLGDRAQRNASPSMEKYERVETGARRACRLGRETSRILGGGA